MKKILIRLIKFFKNYDHYELKEDISSRDLFFIFYYKIPDVIRNIIISIKLMSFKFRLIGKRVKIRHFSNIEIGKGVRIEDYVEIDGLSKDGVIIGDGVNIDRYTVIKCTSVYSNLGMGLKIGNNTGIGAGSFIGCQGGVEIGKDVIIGPGLKVFSENHTYKNKECLIREQEEVRGAVTIKNNVWIGSGVSILSNVVIGEGVVIAAGSVVNKSVPNGVIVGGVPAKIIKHI